MTISVSKAPTNHLLDSIRTQQILDSRTDLVNWILKAWLNVFVPASVRPGASAGGLEYRSESLVQVNDGQQPETITITAPDFPGASAQLPDVTSALPMDKSILPILGGKWSWAGCSGYWRLFSLNVTMTTRILASAAKPENCYQLQAD